VEGIALALAAGQSQPAGDLAHHATGDVDRLVGGSQADLDAACGEPVLAGKDGAEHDCSHTRRPRLVSNAGRTPTHSRSRRLRPAGEENPMVEVDLKALLDPRTLGGGGLKLV